MAIDVAGSILKQTDIRETITNTAESDVGFNLNYARLERTMVISSATDLFFKHDGREMYVVNTNDDIIQYTLSTPWDISTANLTATEDLSAKETAITGLFFKTDGTKFYICGNSGGTRVHEYDLSTAWDITTLSFLQSYTLNFNSPTGLYFREDGKQMIVSSTVAVSLRSHSLSTAWDISTGSPYDTFADGNIGGIFFSRKGDLLFEADTVADAITVKSLSTVFKISSAVDDYTWTILPTGGTVKSIFFNSNGSQVFILTTTMIIQQSIKRGWR